METEIKNVRHTSYISTEDDSTLFRCKITVTVNRSVGSLKPTLQNALVITVVKYPFLNKQHNSCSIDSSSSRPLF